MNELFPACVGASARGAAGRSQAVRRALAAAAPVEVMSEAEKARRLHAELKELEAGRPVDWSDRDRRMRAHEIRQSLTMMGDVV